MKAKKRDEVVARYSRGAFGTDPLAKTRENPGLQIRKAGDATVAQIPRGSRDVSTEHNPRGAAVGAYLGETVEDRGVRRFTVPRPSVVPEVRPSGGEFEMQTRVEVSVHVREHDMVFGDPVGEEEIKNLKGRGTMVQVHHDWRARQPMRRRHRGEYAPLELANRPILDTSLQHPGPHERATRRLRTEPLSHVTREQPRQ